MRAALPTEPEAAQLAELNPKMVYSQCKATKPDKQVNSTSVLVEMYIH